MNQITGVSSVVGTPKGKVAGLASFRLCVNSTRVANISGVECLSRDEKKALV